MRTLKRNVVTGFCWLSAMGAAVGSATGSAAGSTAASSATGAVAASYQLNQEESAPLFREPLEVIVTIEQTVDGDSATLGTLRQVYAGTWLVIEDAQSDDPVNAVANDSQVPRSRRLVDLENRQIVQTNVANQTYWTLSFSRYRDLVRRYAMADAGPPKDSELTSVNGASGTSTSHSGFVVRAQQLDVSLAPQGRTRSPTRGPTEYGPRLTQRLEQNLRRTLVQSDPTQSQRGLGSQGRGAQSWSVSMQAAAGDSPALGSADLVLSQAVTFEPRALNALEAYETAISLAVRSTERQASQLLAAARRESGGLLVVEASTSIRDGFGQIIEGRQTVSSVRVLPRVDPSLLAIPPGFARVPPPLETIVQLLEQERRLDDIGLGTQR